MIEVAQHPDHHVIVEYLGMLIEHHHSVFIACDKGSRREREILAEMQRMWRSFPWPLKKLINQISDAALSGAPHPPEVAGYVKLVADTLAHSRTVILRRTEELIGRRSAGVYPRDDDTTNSNQYIYSVHENVQRHDLAYRDMDLHQFDCLSVKIPLPVTHAGGNLPEVEFIWVWCKGEVEDKLLGDIYTEPMWASGFSEGDEVSFDVDEIHDVHSIVAQPTDTLAINNAEGLECLMYFCEGIDFGAEKANPHLTWFRMSDREKQHIINFCKALREESRRKVERRAKREALEL